jgi:hypothetical protein
MKTSDSIFYVKNDFAPHQYIDLFNDHFNGLHVAAGRNGADTIQIWISDDNVKELHRALTKYILETS